jgi:N-acetyl-anhydromuramyl-L-alanine amidase AmpD
MKIKADIVPNYTTGRKEFSPEVIILHTLNQEAHQVLEAFKNEAIQSSGHYLVSSRGEIWQCVAEENTAWHAGVVSQPLKPLPHGPGVNPNLYSIGIYLLSPSLLVAGGAWNDSLFHAASWLIATIALRHDISLENGRVLSYHELNAQAPALPTGAMARLIAQAKLHLQLMQHARELSHKGEFRPQNSGHPSWGELFTQFFAKIFRVDHDR